MTIAFIDVFVIAIVILIALFILTQVLAPLMKGTPLLPIVRKDAARVKHELEIARHSTEIKRLELELKAERDRARAIEKACK